MLPARDMLAIEDIGHDILPPTTEDGENFPQGARKSEQARAFWCHELSSCLLPSECRLGLRLMARSLI